MIKKTLSLLVIIATFFTAVSLTSCNSSKNEGGEGWPDDILNDVVTLTGANDQGFSVTFRKNDDSPLVTLTFSGEGQRVDTTIVHVGQRFLLAYRPNSGVPYQSGPATAYAYRRIPNIKMTVGTAAENQSWMSEEIRILELWRTGEWVNLNCTAPMVNNYKKLALVVDKTTLDDEMPTAYLLFLSDNSTEAVEQQLVATFDISEIWNDSKYKGLTILAANATGHRRFSFSKDGNEVIRPQD